MLHLRVFTGLDGSAETLAKVLLTGGAGFIGSNFLKMFTLGKFPKFSKIVVLDKLTYAGRLENISLQLEFPNVSFFEGDICDSELVKTALDGCDFIINMAAESHVDRSILNSDIFMKTNVLGTQVLLDAVKERETTRFVQVSTDEVYGSIDAGSWDENSPVKPNSPYSASKAASDHFVSAYFHTYGLPIKRSNCSNNYGSHHHPEKLIPLMINNILNRKSLPIYGEGVNVRDWLWVEDHARAIDLIFHEGKVGCNYNIGGWNEWRNIDLVNELCAIMDELLDRTPGESAELITFVKDRAGHDQRYAIDATKLHRELGWKPSITFEEGLRKTVKWYLDNQAWVTEVTSGHYRDYYKKMYGEK
jgi:dTDP-glucose 4,6-dehydratase